MDDTITSLKTIISDGKDILVDTTKPSSFSNISAVVYYIFEFFGIIFSNLWILFLLLILNTFSATICMLFCSPNINSYKKIYVISMIFDIVILSSILYLHFIK